MQHATQCLSVVDNVLNLHNLLLYYNEIKIHTPAVRSKISSKLILQAVCNAPIAPIAGCVSPLLRIQVGDSTWNYSVACTRVDRVTLINLFAEPYNPFLSGTKPDSCLCRLILQK